MKVFGNAVDIISISKIKSIYPNEWVAMAIEETDADGFAATGEVIMHGADENYVWTAVKLRESITPVYVFYTGPQRIPKRAA